MVCGDYRSARKHGIVNDDVHHACDHSLVVDQADVESDPPKLLLIAPTVPAVCWGSRGRRYKSCQPDNKVTRSEPVRQGPALFVSGHVCRMYAGLDAEAYRCGRCYRSRSVSRNAPSARQVGGARQQVRPSDRSAPGAPASGRSTPSRAAVADQKAVAARPGGRAGRHARRLPGDGVAAGQGGPGGNVTYEQYRWAMTLHIVPLLGAVRLGDLRPEVVDAWLARSRSRRDGAKPRLGPTSSRLVRGAVDGDRGGSAAGYLARNPCR